MLFIVDQLLNQCRSISGSMYISFWIRRGRLRNFTGAVKFRKGLRKCSGSGPPTSNDHNFLVRAPFRVFLDSMESSLTQESIHMPMEGNWCS